MQERKSFALLASYVMLKLHARDASTGRLAVCVHSSVCSLHHCSLPLSLSFLPSFPLFPSLVPLSSSVIPSSRSLFLPSLSILPRPASLPSGAAGIFTARGDREREGADSLARSPPTPRRTILIDALPFSHERRTLKFHSCDAGVAAAVVGRGRGAHHHKRVPLFPHGTVETDGRLSIPVGR